MTATDSLARRFEQDRAHLRQVAYRMLGSLSDADDAVQEAWLRLDRADTSDVDNLTGWLTTVVSRVCLDMLRSRNSRESRHEKSLRHNEVLAAAATTPEQETQLANSVGLALLVVLEQLDPAERLAFVLHDMFAMPFDEIARIVGRTPDATRQLASRARRRVQGAPVADSATFTEQRDTVGAFLKAMRAGDFDGLIAVLHPEVEVNSGGQQMFKGAAKWAKGAVHFQQAGAHVQMASINGNVGLIFAPLGQLQRALVFTVEEGRIAAVEIFQDAASLAALEIAVLDL